MKAVLLSAALLAAAPAEAGGPVILEKPTPVVGESTEDGRLPGWVVPVGVGLVLIALIAGGSICNGEPETPPSSGGC